MLDLVAALRQEFGTSVLLISHNSCHHASAIAWACCRPAGSSRRPVDAVFDDPRHPYAVGLLRCILRGGAGRPRTARHHPGLPAAARRRSAGVRLRGPLRLAQEVCGKEEPAFHDLGSGRHARCHFWERAHELPRAEPPTPVRSLGRSGGAPGRAGRENLRKTFKQEGNE